MPATSRTRGRVVEPHKWDTHEVMSARAWPANLDRRRPRGLAGFDLGAALGIDAIADAVAAPVPLEVSLRLAAQQLGVKFVSLRHYGRYEARLVFKTTGRYEVARVIADSTIEWPQVELEDWLYEQLILGVLAKTGESGDVALECVGQVEREAHLLTTSGR